MGMYVLSLDESLHSVHEDPVSTNVRNVMALVDGDQQDGGDALGKEKEEEEGRCAEGDRGCETAEESITRGEFFCRVTLFFIVCGASTFWDALKNKNMCG